MDKGNKKLLLKIAPLFIENASRDTRELSAVRELGADIIVMTKGEKTGVWDEVNGFRVYRVSSRPFGTKMPVLINRLASWFTWTYHARKFRPDVISCHDLIALYIGWISTWFLPGSRKPKLVYDSHEFTIYSGHDHVVSCGIFKMLERLVIKKCAFVLEVNDLIAEEVQAIHRLKEKPVVVRNIPDHWKADAEVCSQVREKLEKELKENGGREGLFWIGYHGMITGSRGIEAMLRVAEMNPNVAVLILGDGAQWYLDSLKSSLDSETGKRVLFRPAVPFEELWKYAGAVDIGMVVVQAVCKSYYYMLPNKFFEYVLSGTPVICSDFPVIRPLVEAYRLGMVCNPDDPDEINACIEKIRLDDGLRESMRQNARKASVDMSWEKEKKILLDAYAKYL